MTLTLAQSMALGAICSIFLVVLGGSVVEWAKWIGGRLHKVKPSRKACGPQATVGFVDIVVAFFLLLMLFAMAATTWRVFAGPNGFKMQDPEPVEAASSMDTSGAGTESKSSDSKNSSESDNGPVDDNGTGIANETDSKKGNVKTKTVTQNQFLFSGFAISAQLLCVILMTVFICGRTGCSLKKLGWRVDQLSGDLQAGLRCFLMTTPVILILNAVLQGVTKTPYEHPIQEMIKLYPWLLGIAFWQAAIVAPISEEFAFRVLLIGWFESIHFGKNKLLTFLFGMSTTPTRVEPEILSAEIEPFALSPINSSGDMGNPYNAPATSALVMSGSPSQVVLNADKMAIDGYTPPWWPALLSGTLFGLAHFSYGVSWVALILFGIVLGRLYQIRQSIIPVIMVHFLFNGMNIVMLGLSLMLPIPVEK